MDLFGYFGMNNRDTMTLRDFKTLIGCADRELKVVNEETLRFYAEVLANATAPEVAKFEASLSATTTFEATSESRRSLPKGPVGIIIDCQPRMTYEGNTIGRHIAHALSMECDIMEFRDVDMEEYSWMSEQELEESLFMNMMTFDRDSKPLKDLQARLQKEIEGKEKEQLIQLAVSEGVDRADVEDSIAGMVVPQDMGPKVIDAIVSRNVSPIGILGLLFSTPGLPLQRREMYENAKQEIMNHMCEEKTEGGLDHSAERRGLGEPLHPVAFAAGSTHRVLHDWLATELREETKILQDLGDLFLEVDHDAKHELNDDPLHEKRPVPHILFVYGGGPNTLRNVYNALMTGSSAIVIQQSGRMASALWSWSSDASVGAETEKEDEKKKKARLLAKLHRIFNEDDLVNLRKDFPSVGDPDEALIDAIEWICDEKFGGRRMYFQSLDRKTTPDMFLQLVMQAIVDSSDVKRRVKIPLALCYRNHEALSEMLEIGGILEHHDSKLETTMHDARNPMYAAYNDDADSVRQLMDYGVGKVKCGHPIDRLIICEMLCAYGEGNAGKLSWGKLLGPQDTLDEAKELAAHETAHEHEERHAAAHTEHGHGTGAHRRGAQGAGPKGKHAGADLQAGIHYREGKPGRKDLYMQDGDQVALALTRGAHTLQLAESKYKPAEIFASSGGLSKSAICAAFADWLGSFEAMQESSIIKKIVKHPEHMMRRPATIGPTHSAHLHRLEETVQAEDREWCKKHERVLRQTKEKQLHDCHRIYWAIVTKRHKMAKMLWATSKDPSSTAYFAAWVYQRVPDSHFDKEERMEMSKVYDELGRNVVEDFCSGMEVSLVNKFLMEFMYYAGPDATIDDRLATKKEKEANSQKREAYRDKQQLIKDGGRSGEFTGRKFEPFNFAERPAVLHVNVDGQDVRVELDTNVQTVEEAIAAIDPKLVGAVVVSQPVDGDMVLAITSLTIGDNSSVNVIMPASGNAAELFGRGGTRRAGSHWSASVLRKFSLFDTYDRMTGRLQIDKIPLEVRWLSTRQVRGPTHDRNTATPLAALRPPKHHQAQTCTTRTLAALQPNARAGIPFRSETTG